MKELLSYEEMCSRAFSRCKLSYRKAELITARQFRESLVSSYIHIRNSLFLCVTKVETETNMTNRTDHVALNAGLSATPESDLRFKEDQGSVLWTTHELELSQLSHSTGCSELWV